MRKSAKVDPRLVELEKISCESSIVSFKSDIIAYLQNLANVNSRLNPVMIDNQPEINWTMRPYILDFLIELHGFFKLNHDTLYLACFIADKYCSKRIVYKKHYQLLIATSLWIAAKFKDVKTKIPTLKELCLLCHRIYDANVFLQMEKHILTTLEWSIGSLVSTFDMFQLLLSTSVEEAIPKDSTLLNLASFFCDLSLYNRNYLCYSSSTKAITALLIASRILGQDTFPKFLVQLMTFSTKTNDICFNVSDLYKRDNDDFDDYDNFDKYDDFFDEKVEGAHPLDELSSMICTQKVDDIRNCFFLFLSDIFNERLGDNKESISHVLLKKYRYLSIEKLLESYRAENFGAFANLCCLRNSLKHPEINFQPELFQSQCRNSISTCIDKLAGFKTVDEELIASGLSLVEKNNLFASPLTPLSSLPISKEYNEFQNTALLPTNLSNLRAASNSYSAATPFSSYRLGSNPPTPVSVNSCFSGNPRLSFSSCSTSSISHSTNSIISPAGLLKKSFRSNSRHSPSHFQPTLSRKSSTQSEIFELINK